LADTWAVRAKGQAKYDLSVYGPNGYLRSFAGSIDTWDKANLSVTPDFSDEHGITLEIENKSHKTARLQVFDAYTKRTLERSLAPRQTAIWHWSLEDSYGWYDLSITVESDPSFRQQLAGHVETGKDSMSDPLFAV
jgi:phospholipase C